MLKSVKQFVIYTVVSVLGMLISHYIPQSYFWPWVIVSLLIGHLINRKNYVDIKSTKSDINSGVSVTEVSKTVTKSTGIVIEFVKELDGRWFAVIPTYTGKKDDLEMVLGADSLLDIIAQGDGAIRVFFSTSAFNGVTYTLVHQKPDENGAWYKLESELFDFDVWLCNVTEFVFGSFPNTMFICRAS